MNRRKIFTCLFAVLAVLAAVASAIAYFVLRDEKPWLAFFVACCGGMLAFNFLVSLFLVRKNFRKDR